MTSDPGVLVLVHLWGGGTPAYAAELRARRWITCDTSRVAINVARSVCYLQCSTIFERAPALFPADLSTNQQIVLPSRASPTTSSPKRSSWWTNPRWTAALSGLLAPLRLCHSVGTPLLIGKAT